MKGRVNLQTLVYRDDETDILRQVSRTDDNVKRRPNAWKRHNPIDSSDLRPDDSNFLCDTDLEWASLNYRKEKAA